MINHAEAKRKDRARKRAEGYVLKQIWVKPESWAKIKLFIDVENMQNDQPAK